MIERDIEDSQFFCPAFVSPEPIDNPIRLEDLCLVS
jgi:hypothetical protein